MTGLVGWWPLHEDSGSKAYDLSGNSNHGTLNGGITQGVAGKGGLTAYSFDGSDGYISYGNTHSNFSKLTFSFWSRHPSFVEGQHIWHPKNDNDIRVRETSDGIDWLISDNQGTNHVLSAPGSTEEWNFWAGVFDGSEMRLFRNGSLQASTSVSSVGSQSGNDTIGATSGNTSNWEGTLHDFRVYRRALTQQEIQELYEWGHGDYARPPESSDGGVSRWALDGDVTDSWNSNDGTTNGGLNFTNNAIRGQAANFDGVDDYIQTPLTSLPSKVSFSFWMKHSESTSGSKVISGVFDGNVSYQLQFNDGNYSWASYDGSSFHGLRNGPKVNLGEWIHVCAVYDGSDYIIYENGIEIDRTTDTFYGDNVSGVNIPIGAQSDSGNIKEYFDGIIDDFRIYGKALSPVEIFELYRWGTRGRDMRKFTVNSRGL